MTNKLILAHDLGTSGNKATLFDQHGKIVDSTVYTYETLYLQDNWVEQDPNDWWRAVCKASQKLIESTNISPEEIACITFSGQMMGAVAVDESANSLRPAMIWADVRAEKEAEEVIEKMGLDTLYQLTGNRVTPSYSGAKISWIKKNQREIYDNTYKFLQAKDFIVAKLTGVFATDYSDASGTNLLDIHKKQWSDPLLQAFDIAREKLPDILPSTVVAGHVHEEASLQTGLKIGTPVVIGGADGSCAALGAGIIEEGDIFNYIGSSSWISLASNQPLIDKKMRTFNLIHLDDSKYLPIGTMQAAGSSFEWVKNQLYADMLDKNVYDKMNEDAMASQIGANGLLFLPYLLGERSPWWNFKVRGGFIGLSMSHNRQDMVRATIEGISLNLKLILDTFKENGKNVEEMWLFGGGANSRLWGQILADLYGTKIRVPERVDETTSMGAAIVGGIGVGLLKDFSVAKTWCQENTQYHPVQKNKEKYKKLQAHFVEVYERLEPTYHNKENMKG